MVLSLPVRTKIETSMKIILACAVLHDMTMIYKVPLEVGIPLIRVIESPPAIPDVHQLDKVQSGNLRRQEIVRDFFSNSLQELVCLCFCYHIIYMYIITSLYYLKLIVHELFYSPILYQIYC